MRAIVRVALNKPYTFVVLAMLIVCFGFVAAVRTTTDTFPYVSTPVVPLSGQQRPAARDVETGHLRPDVERASAQVNDIGQVRAQVD
jgi:multidrug efflux pump subunit AcrB